MIYRHNGNGNNIIGHKTRDSNKKMKKEKEQH